MIITQDGCHGKRLIDVSDGLLVIHLITKKRSLHSNKDSANSWCVAVTKAPDSDCLLMHSKVSSYASELTVAFTGIMKCPDRLLILLSDFFSIITITRSAQVYTSLYLHITKNTSDLF